MEKMNDLRDLLKHEIDDLCSAEEQIIEALPAMIEKATNSALKNSLTEHLRVTEQQRDRLGQVLQILSAGNQEDSEPKKKKFFGIFGGSQKCKGMEGIISEGKKTMNVEMDPDVMDAALIACAQKIEHYEICGYGTARSFANELGLNQVASLLELTLDEEYDADDKLTFLAESRINKQAEKKESQSSISAGSQKPDRQSSKTKVRNKEMELEPVSTRKQHSESKKEERQGERGGHPKATSTPRSTSGRTAGSSSKGPSDRSRSSSNSRKPGESSRKGRSGSSRIR